MTDRFFRLWALIKKEFLTILRDPKSRIIIIAPAGSSSWRCLPTS